MTFVFDKNYNAYWKKKVKNTSEGPRVPEKDVKNFFLKKLNIKKSDILLDLGCAHGNLFSLLKKFTPNIFGIDVNTAALIEAKKYPYKKVSKGSAEKTGLPKDYFNTVIAWAVYDVVEQEQGLLEENRILKTGGTLLITGKNKKYRVSDREAFIAERNAKLKDFPNHFTDVRKLIRSAKAFGFEVTHVYGFEKRGDFGMLKHFDIKKALPAKPFYEFFLILKKVGESTPASKKMTICNEFSDTAIAFAKKDRHNKFMNMKQFFKWHKETYGD